MRKPLLLGTAAAALVSTTALAHHGWSSYDATRTVTFDSPVLASSYQNPHGTVEIQGDGGRWTVTLAPPSRMTTRGLPEADIAVGKRVRVEGYPSRVTEREMRAERISVDGRVIELR